MFAIINNKGKQYKVAKDTTLKIDAINCKDNDKITFDEVLLVNDGKNIKVGSPVVSGATVLGTVIEQKKDPKIIVFKKKRRHNYRRKIGHRQNYTLVKIEDIKIA